MKEQSNAGQALKENAEHSEAHEAQDKQEDDHAHSRLRTVISAEEVKEILDSIAQDTRRTEINGSLDDPLFLELMKDAEFLRTLDVICQRTISKYRASSVYSWEDLRQDVLIKFGKWLSGYRHEASLKTVLVKIAINQLVDVSRRKSEQAGSLDEYDLELKQYVEADIVSRVRIKQLLEKLKTDEERQLFVECVVEGRNASEIGKARGVTRQAVSKQLARLAQKLKPFV